VGKKLVYVHTTTWHVSDSLKMIFVAGKVVARWPSTVAWLWQFQNLENYVFTFEFAPNLAENPYFRPGMILNW